MLSRLVCSKNNLFFAFLVAGYIFDVILVSLKFIFHICFCSFSLD